MTVKISPHKISKILRGYFRGQSQNEIAKAVRIDQSSVSHYASQFKETVAQIGLLAAGKEYQVMNEVASLRSLSFELDKLKLTPEDAEQGYKIVKAFMKLGIVPEQHVALVEICKKVADPGFIQAALKFNRIETEGNISYEEVVSRFEKALSELPPTENKLRTIQTKVKSLSDILTARTQELANLEVRLAQLQKDAKAKLAKLEQEFENKKKELNVRSEEVEEVAKLKVELGKQGLDIPTLVRLAKEYGYGNPQD